MRKFIALFAAVLILGAGGVAMASETANQTVTYEIEAINELSVSGNPGALTVNAAVAGAAPTAVEDATLTANLAAPTGGTSANAVALTAVAADFVTGISTLNETSKSITYGLSATSAAGVVASATKTVTFTIAASI
jgi:hypothetical protein